MRSQKKSAGAIATRPTKKRRAKGEGALSQRSDGRWQFSITVQDQDGRKRRRYFYGRTKAEATDNYKDAVARSGGSLGVAPVGSVAAMVESWLRDTVKPSTTPNTHALYETMWNHAKPSIGDVMLRRFGVDHVKALARELRETKRPSVPSKVVAVLKTAFTRAIQDGIYDRANPFDRVTVKPPKAKEGRALSLAEAQRFLDAAQGTEYEALWVLLLSSGLRLGEALGLEWSDVNMRTGAVSVRQSVCEINGYCEVREPKTGGSRRRVDIGPRAIAALRKIRKRNAHGFIFTTATGGHPRRSNLRQRELVPICKKAKITGLTIHGLRHTATSISLAQGSPPVAVAAMLGHANAVLVNKRYGHALPTASREASLAIDRALRPKVRSAR